MGARGPKPKPTTIKRLEGNPGKRPLNEREPNYGRPDTKDQKPPAILKPEAKKVWKRIVPQMVRLGVYSDVDRETLIVYCQAYAEWEECVKFINEHGYCYQAKDKNGKTVQVCAWPQVTIMNKAAEKIKALAGEFGLTPSSRSRVTVPEGMTGDPNKVKFLQLLDG